MSQGTDSVRTNLAGLRRERGKRGWRGGGERGKDIKAQQERWGSLRAWNRSPKRFPRHFQLGTAAELRDPPAPRPQPTPPGCEQQPGGLGSCHGPSVNRGSASTILFLAGAFWGEGKEPARNTLSRQIFGGKAGLKVGAQEKFDSEIRELRAGFGICFRGWGGISVMLRPPQSHAAPETHSGQLRLLQHHSPKCQVLPIPGARLPSLPAGQGLRQLRAWRGGLQPLPPKFAASEGEGWGGGCRIAPSEVPPAQSLSPRLNQKAGLGGIFSTKEQL